MCVGRGKGGVYVFVCGRGFACVSVMHKTESDSERERTQEFHFRSCQEVESCHVIYTWATHTSHTSHLHSHIQEEELNRLRMEEKLVKTV